MCQYQTLFHDDNTGYVVRCSSCNKIQIGYGNLMLNLGTGDFKDFCKWLQQVYAENKGIQNKTVRNIVIPTPCEGMKLLLSIRELRTFNSMLEKADTELQSLLLLKLFESS